MATAPSPPILIWTPGGGVPGGPVSNPPVYSQADVTPLVQGQQYVDVVFGSTQTDDTWVLVACEVYNNTDLAPLNIWPGIITSRTAAGFRLYLNGLPDTGNYYLHWAVSGVNIVPGPATLYLFTGPTSGSFGVNKTFTVKLPPSTTLGAPITVTPDDGGLGGTFSPPTVTLSSGSAIATFTYQAVAYGAATLSVTNSGTLVDPAPIVFTSIAPTYTLSGPTGGDSGVASTNFTVQLTGDATLVVPTTVTPSSGGGGGTFTPTSVLLVAGVPVHFTYTPVSVGAKTISVTNNGGLTNPGNLTYTVVPPPFVPTDIAGLKLWLKADSLVLSDGAAVSAWNDSSSNAANFTQVTGANQPIFKTAIVNGLPVVRFNGTSQDLTNVGASIVPTDATQYTFFAVSHIITPPSGNQDLFVLGAAPTAWSMGLRRDATAWYSLARDSGGAAQSAADTSSLSSGDVNLITCDWNGTNLHIWRNGTLKGTTALATRGSSGTYNYVGSFYEVAEYYASDIAEILIYNSALSSTDRGNVETYLKTKYGIP